MIIEQIVFGSLIVLFLLVLADSIQTRSSRKELKAKLIRAEIDKSLLADRLMQLMAEKDANGIENSEGFLKFISESRDWAFKYIEDVQAALDEFDTRISPILEYYSTYGTAIDGLHTGLTKDISQAYEDLKKILPAR